MSVVVNNSQTLKSPETPQDVLVQEGILFQRLPQGLQKSQSLIQTAIELFRIIPDDLDARWQLAAALVKVNDTYNVKPLNLENALLAIYLSEIPSFRRGFCQFLNEEPIRHLARAINNLAAYPLLRSSFDQARESFATLNSNFSWKLELTDSISKGKNKRGITGCPEALYQLRLFEGKKYVGRTGFNIHRQSDLTPILSITNMQGCYDCQGYMKCFREQFDTNVFKVLIRATLKLARQFDEKIIIRGLDNPKHEPARPLYFQVFKALKVDMYSGSTKG